uniref:Uncharacterized protein n=1 Tax=Mus spicilegus TaxID=10103 RepID=A0A8C6HMG8_MUSSI
MNVHTPPTLQKLAIQTLVREEAIGMSDLEELAYGLFPELFKEAFDGRYTKLIKALEIALPFHCLPVGSLMRTPDLETLQAVVCHHSYVSPTGGKKLQFLDLQNVHHNFWNISTDSEDSDCLAEILDGKQAVKVHLRYALRQHLKVRVDLCIGSCLDEAQAWFLKWAQERKGSLYFCCTKMKIWALPVKALRQISHVFDPKDITELELNTEWILLELAHFASYLGTRVTEVKCINKFASQFSKFNCLQHLFMFCIHFLRFQMNQVLGCLMTPLKTLSITYSLISQRDLDSFACCQSLFQLKHLELREVVLLDLDLMHLRGLLMKVAGTLETLDLQGCRMKDSQLSVLLPAFKQCSQISNVNYYNDDFSMPFLKDLLQHTANWSKMNVEQYPAPLKCYNEFPQVSVERFAQLCQDLMDTLRAIRQPKTSSFVSILCCCWQ